MLIKSSSCMHVGKSMVAHKTYLYTPYYAGSFDSNYIIFRSVEIFKIENN